MQILTKGPFSRPPAAAILLALSVVLTGAGVVGTLACAGDIPAAVKNSQDPKDIPLTPAEALKKFRLPDGFRISLFAGEPDVAQPISFCFDDRGRLWVAECYSYKEWNPEEGHDRVLIFEDTDGDGRYDRRQVFLDGIANLTSVQVGLGGVWLLSAPHLLFVPDRNRDGVPDAPATIELTGWTLLARHNIVSGLDWGPDGWLYGLHGIVADSFIRRPGPDMPQLGKLNCGVWRYHPARKKFEVVARGTTNPWGLDWDDHGEAFITNCVIDHLWHVVPGAHYRRMYGRDYNPYLYDLMKATSDHIHWGGGPWQESRGGDGKHDLAGGGHAHVGAMIYLADNWPGEYRGRMFTCNVHGRRLNSDRLVRKGSGYVGKHAEDLVFCEDPWFRGVSVKYGPDGGVFISDWSDLGECHDNDGVHRTSGRIYKVVYGQPQEIDDLNIAKLSNTELVKLQAHPNDWYVRRARLMLQERAIGESDMQAAHLQLARLLEEEKLTRLRLRALWALHCTGGLEEATLLALLEDEDEHLRSWAVKLLCDGQAPSAAGRTKFIEMAKRDRSGLVLMYLAAALQRLPTADRLALARPLLGREGEQVDHNLAMMIWYGIEPAVAVDKKEAVRLLGQCKIARVREFIAKRLAEASADSPPKSSSGK